MNETRWWKYLSSLMGEENNSEAAKKSGISSSNFTRWKKGARADPDFVVKIARAYGVNVLEALVAADFITKEEAGNQPASPMIAKTLRKLDTETKNLHAAASLATESVEKLRDIMRKVDIPDELAKRRHTTPETPPHVRVISDDELAEAIREANQLKGAAHPRTEPLTEPDSP